MRTTIRLLLAAAIATGAFTIGTAGAHADGCPVQGTGQPDVVWVRVCTTGEDQDPLSTPWCVRIEAQGRVLNPWSFPACSW